MEGPFYQKPIGVSLPVRRFAVWQKSRLRACDNFRRSKINEATTVATPIVLPGSDHLSYLADVVRSKCGSAGIFKADHSSAFKQLKLHPDHMKYALIAVLDPDGKVCYFKPKTLLFGSAASVIHYNGVSRVVASLFCRIFKIPILGYIDDFDGVAPAGIDGIALQLFHWFNEILGFKVKLSKSKHGPSVEFLGVVISTNPRSVTLSISDERRIGLLDRVSKALETSTLTPSDASVLGGKLAFAQYYAFGRFGRSFMQRIYAQSAGSFPQVSVDLSDLVWWSFSRHLGLAGFGGLLMFPISLYIRTHREKVV